MIGAVGKVRERLSRAVAALEAAGVPYAVVGGNAVAAWVSRVDEAAVRKGLLNDFGIEIGAGLGPLKGKVWRVGLMGETSKRENVEAFLSALKVCLT